MGHRLDNNFGHYSERNFETRKQRFHLACAVSTQQKYSFSELDLIERVMLDLAIDCSKYT